LDFFGLLIWFDLCLDFEIIWFIALNYGFIFWVMIALWTLILTYEFVLVLVFGLFELALNLNEACDINKIDVNVRCLLAFKSNFE